MTLRERIAEWLTPQKASTGIGAMMMTHGNQLAMFSKDPRKGMEQAQRIGIENLYIRAAERVIGDRFSTVPWHLEDGNDEELINDAVSLLLERPYRPQKNDPVTSTPKTRSGLWRITSRHLGLCGNAFWYLDQTAAMNGFPLEILYINPARMTPAVDDAGNLRGWVLDADAFGHGTPLAVSEVLHFKLEPGDYGHYGIGLVESAFSRVEMLRLSDRQANDTMASGGRLAGVFAPSAASAASIPEDQYQQLVKDLRAITEAPDAARRSLVLRGPIEYTKTTASPSELDLTAISELGRDGILDLWGVPLSRLSGRTGAVGLGGQGSKDADEASLWMNAVQPRLRAFSETIQFQLLDRLEPAPELEVEYPEFDDEHPKYERAQLANAQPLTNAERREILGLEPTGDDDFDQAIYLPISLSEVWTVGKGEPEKAPVPAAFMQPPAEEEDAETPDDEDVEAKARAIPGVDRVRSKMTRSLERDVGAIIERMKDDVARRVKSNAGHLATHPNDDALWWNEKRWRDELMAALKPQAMFAAEATYDRTRAVLGEEFFGKADLRDSVLMRLIGALGSRIGGILDTTRDKVRKTIADGVADGLGAAELGRAIEESAGFGEYRAEMIARTETNRVLNLSQLYTYDEFGVDQVRAIDGDDDATCAARNGQVYSVQESLNIEDHPNGTLDWAPMVLGREVAT